MDDRPPIFDTQASANGRQPVTANSLPPAGTFLESESLPLYLNNQLTPAEREVVEAWLARDPAAQAELAFYRRLRRELQQRPRLAAPPHLAREIVAQATAVPFWQSVWQRSLADWFYRGAGAALSLLCLLLLWSLVQPGLALEWTVSGQPPEAFRVYRAPLGGGSPTLLSEIPVQPGTAAYRYVDNWLLPGGEYRYWVEAVNGGLVQSERVVGRSWELLPYQLALLLASLVMGYSLVLWLPVVADWWAGHGRRAATA
jgi:hypothetical protein